MRFVELVGSDKLQQGGNRGLLSLNLVVSALENPKRKASERVGHLLEGSPLTRILSDSIRGTAMSVVLCCVSPLAADIQETSLSLEFARSANKICNDPKPRITLIPLSRNDMDDDEDISQVRSASVTRGNLPPLSPPSDDVDGSYINNNINDAESSISISTFSQHLELQQEQQAQLLAQHLHQIAPPPPPGVDPILYNLHLIQYSGLLNAVMPPPPGAPVPVAQPNPMGSGFDNRHLHNSQLAAQPHQDPTSPQRSSPTLSPLSQKSPLSANFYWQSTPTVQTQRNSQQFPPPLSLPPPLLDPATAPINLAAEEIERRGSEEGSIVRKSEGDAAAKSWRTPKMPSILEVSENGSVTNSSTSTTTGANVNATANASEMRGEEMAVQDGEDDGTSEAEVDSEEFDSECSDFSGEEEDIGVEVDTASRVTELISQFVADTNDVVRESELERPVTWARSKPIDERLAALHLQPENHTPKVTARPEQGDGFLRELRRAHDTIKVLESREGQLREGLSVISSREEALKAEAEHAKHLRASLEEHMKENEVTVFSEGTMKKDCDRLRKYKEVRKEEKARLTTDFEVLQNQMNVNPEDEGVAAHYTAVGSRIAELDELFNTVDLAIEFKNKKLTGKALDYLGDKSSGDDPDFKDKDLIWVLKRLSTEECRALIHELQLRTITLRRGLLATEVENLQQSFQHQNTVRYIYF